MKRLLLALFAASVTAIACGDSAQAVKPQKATTNADDDDDDDDNITLVDAGTSSSSSGGGIIDAATGGAAVGYLGTLEKTPSIQFGGGAGHCTYNIILSAIEVELAITPDGNVIGGTAKNNMTESLVGTCANQPLGTKPMAHSFQSMSGDTLTFVSKVTGAPKSTLTLKLTKSGSSYAGAASWVRADRTDDLKWTVNATFPIAIK